MGPFLYEFLIKKIRQFFENTFSQIAEINKQYAVPHLKTNKWTKVALLTLRIYLIVLVVILFYKFFSLLK